MLRAHRLALLASLSVAIANPALAQDAPPAPVEMVVEGVFGTDALQTGGYNGVLVTLTNRTARPFVGTVEVGVSDRDGAAERHVVALDLPASESRRVQLAIFVPSTGVSIDARYLDADGNLLGFASQGVPYDSPTPSVVVLSDQPARLRAALLDLEFEDTGAPHAAGLVTVAVPVPVGGNTLDGRTGDPIVPSQPQAYATVRLVIASAPTLARLSEAELRALLDYVVAGGTLAIAPRTPADHALPVVRDLFGEVSRDPERFAAAPYAPEETPLYGCSAADRLDGAGCVRVLGHGLVRLLSWDLTSPVSASATSADTAAHRLVLALLGEASSRTTTAFRFGSGMDDSEDGGSWWDGSPSFGALRRALDPNEGYRTSLALVSVLLFLYVLIVGPVHFKIIERRNQPTLALLTTPAIALACVIVLFGVGYIGKGVVMRYRRFALVELAEGSVRGTSRSYTGYFFTRPASATLTPEPGTTLRRVAAPGGNAGPRYLHHDDGESAESIRGGLWDTIFMREERMLDVSGGIRFERAEDNLRAVINDSDWDLRSAILVDLYGGAHVVGDVPAHGRAPIPEATGWYLYENGGYGGSGEGDATTTTLSAVLRVPAQELPMLRGVQTLLGTELIENTAPVLYAWIDEDAPPDTSPGFSLDWDRRLLRVASLPPWRDIAAPRTYGARQ